MKNKLTLVTLVFTLISFVGFSQKTVNASSIIKSIKAGKNVSISNATIVGDLDFTFMEEKLKDLPKRKKKWKYNKDNKVKNSIKVGISFKNCTFKDNVLAYIPDHEDSGYTFTASFEKKVLFTDCVFEEKAMFKYSDFDEDSSFANTEFQDDSTFKYAKFKESANFQNTQFDNEATFKYAVFSTFISFSDATFKESATFKYTKFKNGVSFKSVKFEEDLNIKYTQVKGKFDISGMKVTYNIDSKYTKINGKGFSKYLLDN